MLQFPLDRGPPQLENGVCVPLQRPFFGRPRFEGIYSTKLPLKADEFHQVLEEVNQAIVRSEVNNSE